MKCAGRLSYVTLILRVVPQVQTPSAMALSVAHAAFIPRLAFSQRTSAVWTPSLVDGARPRLGCRHGVRARSLLEYHSPT
eukprot:5039121-Prymnesium_polylepis.3